MAKRTLEQRIHDQTHDDGITIEAFGTTLMDRQIMAIRQHARWAARRIAFTLSQQYDRQDTRFLTDLMINRQLRHYNVNEGAFKYGRKVVKEKIKELWP